MGGLHTRQPTRADGMIGVVVRVSTTRTTPASATVIRLRPEATRLLADASYARLVFVDVVEANGTVVPTDTSSIALEVSGAGSIVGPTSIVMKGGHLPSGYGAQGLQGPLR